MLKSNLTLFVIGAILVFSSLNMHYGKNRWEGLVNTMDADGYYAYLPAILIYQDLSFSFRDKIAYLNKSNTSPDYRTKTNTGIINKYYVGTAICQTPFFILGALCAYIFNYELNGYSKPFILFLNFAAIVYAIVGLYFLKKILQKYSVSNSTTSFILFAVMFGTQLFYYTVGEPLMSHAYSFAIITCTLYQVQLFFKGNFNKIYLIALLTGLIVLIKPVNILIIFLFPFFATTDGNYKLSKKNNLTLLKFAGAFLIFLLIISVQPIIYKIQTNNFLVYSYGGEKFNWSNPEFFNILFSYKKGLFLYTPLILLSLTGIVPLFKRNRSGALIITITSIIILYVLSSWWSWWYGYSFSIRAYTEFLAINGILLAFLLNSVKPKFMQRIITTTIVVLVFVCQIQTYQYRHLIIHGEKMDRDHYWRVFLRVDQMLKDENANQELLQN